MRTYALVCLCLAACDPARTDPPDVPPAAAIVVVAAPLRATTEAGGRAGAGRFVLAGDGITTPFPGWPLEVALSGGLAAPFRVP